MINYNDYVDGIINKDNEAFRIVYENTKKGVFSMIISIVKNKTVTEDLMQETYMKMIKNIHQYKRGKNFNAWLLQIAKNTALDYYRKEKRIVTVDPQDNAFEGSVSSNEEYLVLDMIKNLDEEEKRIVLLRVVSNTKFKDISKLVDKPIGTVLWIYNKALNKLKKEYK